MTQPSAEMVTDQLRAFVEAEGIRPDPNYRSWHSGVYAVLDCVFSARVKYERMVLPILREHLPQRAGLSDAADLRFSQFIENVDAFGQSNERFERYTNEVIGYRHKLSRRFKVQVAYDVCRFFVTRQVEVLADFAALPETTLDKMVLEDLVQEVFGIGPVLARYLMMLVGREDHIKPDTMLVRLFTRLSGWQSRFGYHKDMELMKQAVSQVAAEMGTTPARLDNALWASERNRCKR